MKLLLSTKKRYLIPLLILSLLSTAAITYSTQLLGQFTDAMTTMGINASYVYLVSAIVLVAFNYMAGTAIIWFVIQVIFSARLKILARKVQTAKSWEALWNESEVYQEHFFAIYYLFSSLLGLAAAVIVMALASWMLALVALGGILYVLLVSRLHHHRLETAKKARLAVQNRVTATLNRASENYATLAHDGAELLALTAADATLLRRLSTRVDRLNAVRNFIAAFSLGFVGVSVVIASAVLIYYRYVSIGSLVTVGALFALFAGRVRAISGNFATMRNTRWITKEIDEVDLEYANAALPVSSITEVHLQAVAKMVAQRQILAPVSLRFKVNRRATVLITGPNGAGKTTLARIIAGLDQAFSGRVLFNKAPRNPYVSSSIIYQTSATQLLPGTVRANILNFPPADQTVDEARLAQLAADLQITHLLERMVTDLSAGEVGLVKVAHMLYAPAAVRIYDEIFANLDVDRRDAVIDYALAFPGLHIVIAHHPIAHAFDHRLALAVPAAKVSSSSEANAN